MDKTVFNEYTMHYKENDGYFTATDTSDYERYKSLLSTATLESEKAKYSSNLAILQHKKDASSDKGIVSVEEYYSSVLADEGINWAFTSLGRDYFESAQIAYLDESTKGVSYYTRLYENASAEEKAARYIDLVEAKYRADGEKSENEIALAIAKAKLNKKVYSSDSEKTSLETNIIITQAKVNGLSDDEISLKLIENQLKNTTDTKQRESLELDRIIASNKVRGLSEAESDLNIYNYKKSIASSQSEYQEYALKAVQAESIVKGDTPNEASARMLEYKINNDATLTSAQVDKIKEQISVLRNTSKLKNPFDTLADTLKEKLSLGNLGATGKAIAESRLDDLLKKSENFNLKNASLGKLSDLESTLDGFRDKVNGAFDSARDALNGKLSVNLSTPDLSSFKGKLTGSWENAKSTASNAWENARGLFTNAKDKLSGMWSDSKSAVSDAWGNAKSQISGLGGKITDAFGNAKSSISGAGDRINGAISGLKDKLSGAKGNANDSLNAAKSKLDSAAANLTSNVSNAFSNAKGQLSNSLNGLSGKLDGLLGGKGGGGGGGESTNILGAYINDANKLDDVTKLFNTLKPKSTGSLAALMDAMQSVMSSSAFTGVFSGLQSYMNPSEMLKKAGFSGSTDPSQLLGTFDKLMNKSISVRTDILGDSVKALLSIGDSITNSVSDAIITKLKSKINYNDELVLASVKPLYELGADPNYGNTLLMACIQHDLPKTLEWLDGLNKTEYTDTSEETDRAFLAAKYGSWHVSKYIFEKLVDKYKQLANIYKNTKSTKYLPQITQYKLLITDILREIIVYSYSNLKPDDVLEMIQYSDFVHPSMYGESDYEFHIKFTFTDEQIDIMAPIIMNRTIKVQNPINKGRGINLGIKRPVQVEVTEKYIDPRNENIKKIYCVLVDTGTFEERNVLNNKRLYLRLKLRMISVLTQAKESLIQKFEESDAYAMMQDKTLIDVTAEIANFITTIEELLPNPADNIRLGVGDTEIPEYVPISTGEGGGSSDTDDGGLIIVERTDDQILEETRQTESVKGELPADALLKKFGVTWDMLDIIDTYNLNSKEIEATVNLFLDDHPGFIFQYKHSAFAWDDNSKYYAFEHVFYVYSKKILEDITDEEKEALFYILLIRYLINKYGGTYTFEEIMAMYGTENTPYSRELYEPFRDYYNAFRERYDALCGKYRLINYPAISYYTELVDADKSFIIVTDRGVGAYDTYGKLLTMYNGEIDITSHIPIGVSYYKGNYLLICKILGSSSCVIYSSKDKKDWKKVFEKNIKYFNIYNACGIVDLTALTFYEGVIYHGNKYEVSSDSRFCICNDSIKIWGNNNTYMIGLSVMADGHLFIIIKDDGVYELQNYEPVLSESLESGKTSITANPNIRIIKVAEYYDYNIKKYGLGTIYNCVADCPRINTDFDIDDEQIVRNLVNYYTDIPTTMIAYKYIDPTDKTFDNHLWDWNTERDENGKIIKETVNGVVPNTNKVKQLITLSLRGVESVKITHDNIDPLELPKIIDENGNYIHPEAKSHKSFDAYIANGTMPFDKE